MFMESTREPPLWEEKQMVASLLSNFLLAGMFLEGLLFGAIVLIFIGNVFLSVCASLVAMAAGWFGVRGLGKGKSWYARIYGWGLFLGNERLNESLRWEEISEMKVFRDVGGIEKPGKDFLGLNLVFVMGKTNASRGPWSGRAAIRGVSLARLTQNNSFGINSERIRNFSVVDFDGFSSAMREAGQGRLVRVEESPLKNQYR